MFFNSGVGRLLVFIVAALLGTLTSFALPGCTNARGVNSPTQAQLASVVVLVEQEPEFREPALSSDDFGAHTGDYRFAWKGKCNAFALERRTGELYLVTAAHCVNSRALGAVLRYLPPDGWGVDRAVLVKLDSARDYAELAISRRGGLEPLPQGPAPATGEPVVSFSAFYQAQAPGRAVGAYTGSWYGTTQRIAPGWSGSPALDSRGRAWGFVAKCETEHGHCARGAIVGLL